VFVAALISEEAVTRLLTTDVGFLWFNVDRLRAGRRIATITQARGRKPTSMTSGARAAARWTKASGRISRWGFGP